MCNANVRKAGKDGNEDIKHDVKNQPFSLKCFIVTNSFISYMSIEVGVYTEIRLACKTMTIILWEDTDSVNRGNNPWYQLTGEKLISL